MAAIKVGVMGAANDALPTAERARLAILAERLAGAIADRGWSWLPGPTTGLPDVVARAATRNGAPTSGISPAISRSEHVDRYRLPEDGAEIVVYTGFGLKGRNVINIRSCDIVI